MVLSEPCSAVAGIRAMISTDISAPSFVSPLVMQPVACHTGNEIGIR